MSPYPTGGSPGEIVGRFPKTASKAMNATPPAASSSASPPSPVAREVNRGTIASSQTIATSVVAESTAVLIVRDRKRTRGDSSRTANITGSASAWRSRFATRARSAGPPNGVFERSPIVFVRYNTGRIVGIAP